MIDREKVIRGLECCEHPYEKKCDACPYILYTPDSMECTAYLSKDALELLREQQMEIKSVRAARFINLKHRRRCVG